MTSRRTALVLASALLITPVPVAPGQQTSSSPDAVEEDWVLVVGTPDPIAVGPQITTVMSPSADEASPFVAFDIDYQEYPTFRPGGMQIQIWSPDRILTAAGQGYALFNTPGETITWTQRMALSNGTLRYSIENGNSVTWGKFGQGQGTNLNVSFSTSLSSLAGYDPQVSTQRSGVSWQEDNVTSLVLKQVRYYANNQLVWTDVNPRALVSPED